MRNSKYKKQFLYILDKFNLLFHSGIRLEDIEYIQKDSYEFKIAGGFVSITLKHAYEYTYFALRDYTDFQMHFIYNSENDKIKLYHTKLIVRQ